MIAAGGVAALTSAAPSASAQTTASVTLDLQVSVNGGATWQDVGVGNLSDPTVNVGQQVDERAIVTGTVALSDVTVSEQATVGSAAPATFTFGGSPSSSLAAGDTVTSDVLTVAALPGYQLQTGTVTATVSGTTTTVTATDQVDYTGVAVYATALPTTSTACSTTSPCSLSTALSQVTAGETIDLVTAGSAAHYGGNFTVNAGTAGSPVTIQPAPGVTDPTLDAKNSGTVLTIKSGVYVNLTGITITGGNNTYPTGGGIYNSGTLTVTDSTITGNTAGGNTAPFAFGGGINNSGTLTVTDSTISGNTASAANGGLGGGIANNNGTLTVTDSTISGNNGGGIAGGGAGGGIANLDGTVTVTDSTISGNYNGGGGGSGGGIYTGGGSVTVTDSTISGNTATNNANGGGFGGGIFINNGGASVTVIGSTITGNTAAYYGAIYNVAGFGSFSAGLVTLAGDVLATSGGVPSGGECAGGGTFTDLGYNVADDTSCGFNSGKSVQSSSAELLGALQNNGGPTLTIEPSAGNPAIGLIPSGAKVTINGGSVDLCPMVDQRGFASMSGVPCDAGSVQVAAQTISFTAPAGGSVGGTATLSAKGGGSGNPVVFSVDSSGGAGVCTLSGTNNATVTYRGVGECVIDANQAGNTNYAAAATVTQSIKVAGAAPQTISFTRPASGSVGGTYTLSATGGGSGNPVVFSVDSSSGAGVCATSGLYGSTVTFRGVGECVIDANQAGNTDYLPAATVTQSIAVSVTVTDSPQISPARAASDATSFVTGRGYQVLGVKHETLVSQGQKDYFQVKLQLGRNHKRHGTTTVWVDATAAPGTVTAASGSGLHYRDTSIVSRATADANAVAATGGGSVYKTSLHGGKWRWYWVFIKSGDSNFKVGVDAASGVVTKVYQDQGHQDRKG